MASTTPLLAVLRVSFFSSTGRERERGVRLQQRSRTKGSKKKREKIALLLAHAAGVLNGNEVHGNGEEEEGDKIEKENFIRL